jgi:hypothetical protein
MRAPPPALTGFEVRISKPDNLKWKDEVRDQLIDWACTTLSLPPEAAPLQAAFERDRAVIVVPTSELAHKLVAAKLIVNETTLNVTTNAQPTRPKDVEVQIINLPLPITADEVRFGAQALGDVLKVKLNTRVTKAGHTVTLNSATITLGFKAKSEYFITVRNVRVPVLDPRLPKRRKQPKPRAVDTCDSEARQNKEPKSTNKGKEKATTQIESSQRDSNETQQLRHQIDNANLPADERESIERALSEELHTFEARYNVTQSNQNGGGASSAAKGSARRKPDGRNANPSSANGAPRRGN